MHEIVTRLTPAGVDRLEMCRNAECGMMQTIDAGCSALYGQTVCIAQSSRSIGKSSHARWLALWAELLNGDESCPMWRADAIGDDPESISGPAR